MLGSQVTGVENGANTSLVDCARLVLCCFSNSVYLFLSGYPPAGGPPAAAPYGGAPPPAGGAPPPQQSGPAQVAIITH